MTTWTADGWAGNNQIWTADGWPGAQGSIRWTADGFVEQQAGGRPKARFSKYIIRLDGDEYPCKSLAEALEILERAKALAKKLSQERVRAATEAKASKPPPVPEISANSRDLKAAVREARQEIHKAYKSANMDVEIALWFAIEREKEIAQEDDETIALFFM